MRSCCPLCFNGADSDHQPDEQLKVCHTRMNGMRYWYNSLHLGKSETMWKRNCGTMHFNPFNKRMERVKRCILNEHCESYYFIIWSVSMCVCFFSLFTNDKSNTNKKKKLKRRERMFVWIWMDRTVVIPVESVFNRDFHWFA